MREGLRAASTAVGLEVMAEIRAAETDALAGAKGKHQPDRLAYRHGSEAGTVTLGGRRLLRPPTARPICSPRASSPECSRLRRRAGVARSTDREGSRSESRRSVYLGWSSHHLTQPPTEREPRKSRGSRFAGSNMGDNRSVTSPLLPPPVHGDPFDLDTDAGRVAGYRCLLYTSDAADDLLCVDLG